MKTQVAWEQVRQYDEEYDEARVIHGENPQHATRKEIAKVVSAPFRVVQNAGDEKAGEHKEEIDPNPTDARNPRDQAIDRHHRRHSIEVAEMPEHHEDANGGI